MFHVETLDASMETVECFTSLWEAVMSIDGAKIWQQGLQNSGLSLILQDRGLSNGIIFIPMDDGVLGCNSTLLTDEHQWPYGDCAPKARDWLDLFGHKDGASILMYQWIPNQTFSSLTADGGVYETLLGYVSNQSSNIYVYPGATVSLPDELYTENSQQFSNAKIIGMRDLCDSALGGLYIIDHPVYPKGLPAVNTTSLPALEGYCAESILSLLSKHPATRNFTWSEVESVGPLPSPFVSTFINLVASSYPAIPPLFDPMANVTLFAPYADEYLNVLKYVGLEMNDIVGFRKVLPPMTFLYLSHFVPGRYCPEDFKNGLTLQTLAGHILGKNDSLYIKQDNIDANILHIEVLFGDDPDKWYTATYLGQTCFSTVYTLDSFLTPWLPPVIGTKDAQVPYAYISDLPLISQQHELINVDGSCRMGTFVDSQSNELVNTQSYSLTPGALAGVIIGSCCLLTIFIYSLWWCRQKYWKKSQVRRNCSMTSSSVLVQDGEDGHPLSLASLFNGVNRSKHPVEALRESTGSILDEIVLSGKEVSIDIDPKTERPILLGQGKFGKVVRGKLFGAESVAIKCIYNELLDQDLCAISAEIMEAHTLLGKEGSNESTGRSVSFRNISVPEERILHEISLLKSCHSQYIVSFTGVVFQAREVWVVTELLPAGDLWHALGNSCMRTVTWYQGGIFIAMDILAGLIYLHNKRIIHLDLKSSNILLRKSCVVDWSPTIPEGYIVNFRAKISDVGLSKILPLTHEYISSTKVGGTWNWCAPEVILCGKCTSAADMFSFGVVLWEICTGEIPQRGRMRDVQVPSECPEEVANLINACLCYEAKDRPTASDAFVILDRLLHEDDAVATDSVGKMHVI